MKESIIYEIMEYRNCDEHYSWGLYATEELAIEFLKSKNWLNCEDFEILERKIIYKLK